MDPKDDEQQDSERSVMIQGRLRSLTVQQLMKRHKRASRTMEHLVRRSILASMRDLYADSTRSQVMSKISIKRVSDISTG